MTTDPNAVRSVSLNGLFTNSDGDASQRLAIVDGPLRVSYRDLRARSERLAAALLDRGVGQGDRVALVLLNSIASVELILACGRIGAIAVPINWRLSPAEIAYIVAEATPRMLFHSECFTDLLGEASGYDPFVVSNVAPCRAYENLIASASRKQLPDTPGIAPLFMLFTSGTTGRPKPCLQSQQGAVAAGMAFALRLRLTQEDRLLSTSPLFHVGGLGHVFAALVAGAGIILVPRGASHIDILRLASAEKCSFGSMNDGLVMGLCDLQEKHALPLSMRIVTRGASMTPITQIDRIEKTLCAKVIGGYGQTEALGFALTIDGEEMRDHPDALGTPLAHFDAAVLDDNGLPTEGEEIGELGLRGPSVMLGYWKMDDPSAEALGTGWLRTGDLVRRDSQGRYHFSGRCKELVKSGGENVYPREVEQVLLMHPAIADAAIIGVPDEEWGEAVKACIVIAPGHTIDSGSAVAWCRKHIASYKRPRYVEFIAEIPRDHLGKIQRPVLRERVITDNQKID